MEIVNKEIWASYSFPASEWEYWMEIKRPEQDEKEYLILILKQLRRSISEHMKYYDLQINLQFEYHIEIDCYIPERICKVTLCYGPKRPYKYYEIQTEVARRLLEI